jgi:translation initiation factor 5B
MPPKAKAKPKVVSGAAKAALERLELVKKLEEEQKQKDEEERLRREEEERRLREEEEKEAELARLK